MTSFTAESKKPPTDETPEERRERRMKAKLLAKKKRQRALLLNGEGKTADKTAYEQQREELQLQAEVVVLASLCFAL